MDQMHIWTFSPVFGNDLNGASQTIQFTKKTQKERSCTIPIAIHGDEGRGLAKVPLLVIAYQVIIPYSGENHLSSSKYPDLTIYKLFEIWFPISPKYPI